MPRGHAREIDELGRILCPDCGEYKPATEYYKNTRTRLGLSSKCIPCHKAYQKRYNQNDKERKYTLREAAAILQLQGKYVPPIMDPDNPDTELDPERLGEGVMYVAGYGYMEGRPLSDEEIEERLQRTDPRTKMPAPRTAEGKIEPLVDADSRAFRRHQAEMSQWSDSRLKKEASQGSFPEYWSQGNQDHWPLVAKAMWAEMATRGWVKGNQD